MFHYVKMIHEIKKSLSKFAFVFLFVEATSKLCCSLLCRLALESQYPEDASGDSVECLFRVSETCLKTFQSVRELCNRSEILASLRSFPQGRSMKLVVTQV